MEEVNHLFVKVIDEIRRISNNLMPAELSQFGLIDALKNLCKEVSKSAGIEIKFEHSKLSPVQDEKINTYLYRISQEALNNVIKHSKASSSTLEIKSNKNDLMLIISDNGTGFKYSDDRKICGNGITNMKERVQILKGRFDIISNPGEGTEIKVFIPLKGKL